LGRLKKGKKSSTGTTREAPAPAPEPERRASEDRERDIRQGIDLATTLERIEKNFVITDPRLPDNPIVSIHRSPLFSWAFWVIASYVTDPIGCVQIFASDSFLELTEYTREEILGRNCRSAP
jgi:phototropin